MLKATLAAQTVKNLPAMWETRIGKIPWRKTQQPTPVFLPGESPWIEVPGRLQSMGPKRIRHHCVTELTGTHILLKRTKKGDNF